MSSSHRSRENHRSGSLLTVESSNLNQRPVRRGSSRLVIDGDGQPQIQARGSRTSIPAPQSTPRARSDPLAAAASVGVVREPAPASIISSQSQSTDATQVKSALLMEFYGCDSSMADSMPDPQASLETGGADAAYWYALQNVGSIFRIDTFLCVFQDWDHGHEMLEV